MGQKEIVERLVGEIFDGAICRYTERGGYRDEFLVETPNHYRVMEGRSEPTSSSIIRWRFWGPPQTIEYCCSLLGYNRERLDVFEMLLGPLLLKIKKRSIDKAHELLKVCRAEAG